MPKASNQKRRKVSKCRVEGCLGKYVLSYEDNAPIFTCDCCQDKDLTWKKFYCEYLNLFRVKENWDDKKHQVSCIIGYFVYCYQEKFGTNYVFVPKNPNPYGSKECTDSWALLAAFNGNAHEVRRYLHWLFNRGISNKTEITSFGYITTPGLIRKYNLYAKNKNVLSRSSELPKTFLEWCKQNFPDIVENYSLSTMNDLGALLSFVKYYDKTIQSSDPMRVVLAEAEKYNLIISGNLNIGK